MNEGVAILMDQRIVFANQQLERLTGYPVPDVVGRPSSDFWEPEDLPFMRERIAEREATGHMRVEFYLRCRDGSHLPVILSSRHFDIPDEGRYVVVICTDISQQKLAEHRLADANERLEERQRQLDRELELASKIQQSLAPQSLQNQRFAVESYYCPFGSVGGDFGLVRQDGDRLQLLVCDVAGHGISAALLANRVYAEALHELDRSDGPAQLIVGLNAFLTALQLPQFFLTLAAAEIEAATGRMRFASAGHPAALLLRAAGGVEQLEAMTLPIGVISEGAGFASRHVEMAAGDRLLLYTDGFIEVFGSDRQTLGLGGLERIVRNAAAAPLPALKQAVLDGVSAYRHGPLSDDMSLVLVEYRPSGSQAE